MGDQTSQERRVPPWDVPAGQQMSGREVQCRQRERDARSGASRVPGSSRWVAPNSAMNGGPRDEEEKREEKGRKTYISTFRLNIQPSAGPRGKDVCEVEEENDFMIQVRLPCM